MREESGPATRFTRRMASSRSPRKGPAGGMPIPARTGPGILDLAPMNTIGGFPPESRTTERRTVTILRPGFREDSREVHPDVACASSTPSRDMPFPASPAAGPSERLQSRELTTRDRDAPGFTASSSSISCKRPNLASPRRAEPRQMSSRPLMSHRHPPHPLRDDWTIVGYPLCTTVPPADAISGRMTSRSVPLAGFAWKIVPGIHARPVGLIR